MLVKKASYFKFSIKDNANANTKSENFEYQLMTVNDKRFCMNVKKSEMCLINLSWDDYKQINEILNRYRLD